MLFNTASSLYLTGTIGAFFSNSLAPSVIGWSIIISFPLFILSQSLVAEYEDRLEEILRESANDARDVTSETQEQELEEERQDFLSALQASCIVEHVLDSERRQDLEAAVKVVRAAPKDNWVKIIRANGRPLLTLSLAHRLEIEPNDDQNPYMYLTPTQAELVLTELITSPATFGAKPSPKGTILFSPQTISRTRQSETVPKPPSTTAATRLTRPPSDFNRYETSRSSITL